MEGTGVEIRRREVGDIVHGDRGGRGVNCWRIFMEARGGDSRLWILVVWVWR